MASRGVPGGVDPSNFFPFPIFSHFIILIENSEEMVSMFQANILNAEVVYNEYKLHRAPNMAPEARRSGRLMIPHSVEALVEKVVGKSTRLWKTISTADDGEVYPALVDEG